MNYQQTVDFLYAQLPMFHRIGPAAYKADLTNTISICNFLGNPQRKFKSIHIAGTNGKGSSSHMLAAVLQQCGYKTGLYTSPHLVDFRERIRVNGKLIPKKKIIQFVEYYREQFAEVKPSFFEWTVGLAFEYFAEEKVDIAVIETGLGGRLDSTNVIKPLVSLITNIGFDHVDLLGDTLKKIAGEKAGIIKPNTPVVISERQSELSSVFCKKAATAHAPIYFANDEFIPFAYRYKEKHAQVSVLRKSKQNFHQYTLDLPGVYQKKNIAGVLQVLELLKRKKFRISHENVERALSRVKKLTGLRGRFEILGKHPLIIVDTAHNAEGIQEVMQQLEGIKKRKLHFVLGVVNDKDPSRVLKLVPKGNTQYYFTKADLPRSMPQHVLRKYALQFGLKGTAFETVPLAFEKASKNAKKEDVIFIGGSTFVVADLLKYLGQ